MLGPMDVLVMDSAMTGGDTVGLLLQGVPSPLTLRDLIGFGVREEVARHNADPATGTPGTAAAVEGMLRRTIGPLACDEAAADVIRELLDSVARRRHLAPEDRSAVGARLLKLLPAGGHGTVDTSLIAPADGWAARMVPAL